MGFDGCVSILEMHAYHILKMCPTMHTVMHKPPFLAIPFVSLSPGL